jgi:hypothetical protein
MQYALLIYSSPDVLNRHSESTLAEYKAITASPGVLAGVRLQLPESATTVRVGDGGGLLTDGPFVAAKEYLAGLYLYEADDLDAATAMAERIPVARLGGAIEVRPVAEE